QHDTEGSEGLAELSCYFALGSLFARPMSTRSAPTKGRAPTKDSCRHHRRSQLAPHADLRRQACTTLGASAELRTARNPLKFHALFFLKPLIIDAQKPTIWSQFRQIEVLAVVDMRLHVGRELFKIAMFFESFPQISTRHAVDNAGTVNVSTEIGIVRFRGRRDSPSFRRNRQCVLRRGLR